MFGSPQSPVHSTHDMALSPSMDEEAMGDDDFRTARCVMESGTSRSHTTNSSPYDVDDEYDLPRALERPAAIGKSRKVLDDSRPSNDFYRSVETPRATHRDAGDSIRALQIQIESVHTPASSIEITNGVSISHENPRRRRPGGANSGDVFASKTTTHTRCRTVLIQSLAVLLPPVLVLVLLKYSVTYAMLCVLNVVVAFATWEWTWWSFRIRQRLLVSFQSIASPESQSEPPPTTRGEMEQRQDVALNQQQFALQSATTKCCRSLRYNKYLLSGLLSLLISAAFVALVMIFADSIVSADRSEVGERMLFASLVTASFSAFFCCCLSPTPSDSFIVFVYEACFVTSSLNSFLAHHEKVVHDPELLDSMYVLLVGACAIVVWRIVSSRDVMESTIMTMLDMLGLAYLIAPMMAMADFLGHPTVKLYGDVVGTFFVVVSAAEAAYHLNEAAKYAYPRFLACCRRPLVKSISQSLGIESMALSIVFGFVGAVVSVLFFSEYVVSWQDGLVYLGATVMSQFCRLALESMKALAKVDHPNVVKFHPWVSGFMELVNPYLLAMIVFHPYVKALIKDQQQEN